MKKRTKVYLWFLIMVERFGSWITFIVLKEQERINPWRWRNKA